MAEDFDRSLYMSFIPEYLRSNEDFLVFLQLAATEFDITFENIEKFTDLVNPDKVPMKFIEALGAFADYKFVEQADDDFNRELLMRMQSIYDDRGTDHSIIMAATHGDNEGWVGGDIFIPGYPISQEKATLIVAHDKIFTHSRSKHSGGDVFQDGDTYMPGVIVIQLPYVNDEIIEKIVETMPAGVRFKFFTNIEMSGGTDPDYTGSYGELSIHKFYRVVPLTPEEKESQDSAINMLLTLEPKVRRDESNLFIHGAGASKGVHNRGMRSGKQIILAETEYTSLLGASMLAHSVLTKGFLEKSTQDSDSSNNSETSEIIDYRNSLLFRHSTESSKFSSKHKNSGELTLVEDPKEDETEYILSPSGEKLDIKEKTGKAHITRDITSFTDDVALDVQVDYRITAKRSTSSGIRSGRGKLSGIITHEIDNLVRIMEITPQDILYYTSQVNHLKPSDYRDPFYQAPSDIYKQAELFISDIYDSVEGFDNEKIINIQVYFYSSNTAIFNVNTEDMQYTSERILVANTSELESQYAASLLPMSILSSSLSEGDIISSSGEHLDTISKSSSDNIIRDINTSKDVSIDVIVDYLVTAVRSSKSYGVRSGKGRLSGYVTNEISSYASATEYEAQDNLYDTYSVRNMKPSDSKDPFYQPDIEIEEVSVSI